MRFAQALSRARNQSLKKHGYEDSGKIVKNKAAVFISHRLSSCRFCDSIAVFDHGKLVQQGSHATLIKETKGKYHMLWSAQAQYYT